MIKGNIMSVVIYIDGIGNIDGNVSQKTIEDIETILNIWGTPSFKVSAQDFEFEFRSSRLEGSDPYNDGIITPLYKFINYAKKNSLIINGEFEIISEWNDYNQIGLFIKDNELETANLEIRNAATEELEKEVQKRNDLRFALKSADEILAARDENNYVEGFIQIHVSDLIDNDYETFLDIISENLVGSDLLMDVNYEVVALAGKEYPNELILKVSGDASTILEPDVEKTKIQTA